MGEKIKLTIFSEGQEEIEVDREEYEAAKAAGELAEFLDVYTSDIETDESVLEPDGTVVTLPEGNVLPPVKTLPPAWSDLIEGLRLLARHASSDISPLHCEHDTLTVLAEDEAFTDEEIAQLDDLGFIRDRSNGGFYSFRFGSA